MKLIYTAREIESLNKYFKQHSQEYNRDEFLSGVKKIITRAPAMFNGYMNSYDNGKNLQPGYLTEINVCATLAAMLNLSYQNDYCESNVRHCYSNGCIHLKEYGGCNMADVQLIGEDGTIFTLEIKEPKSLGGDFNMGITEEGKLIPKLKAGRVFPEAAQLIINNFNNNDSILNHIGHNIPLEDNEYLHSIARDYICSKNIDYIATYSQDNNNLIIFPVSELDKHVSYKGSEIRTAGKNHVKVYTPKLFHSIMDSIGCIINGDVVKIPKTVVDYRVERNSNKKVSGIKIHPLFFFFVKDILFEDDEYYYANINKARQVNQAIGVHFNLF